MQPTKTTGRKKATATKRAPAKRSRQSAGSAGKDTPLKNGRRGAGKAAPNKGAKKTAKKTARKAVRKAAKKAPSSAWASVISSPANGMIGSVYVIQETGTRKVRTHVAKKASGHEIRETLGISPARLTRVRGMLKALEKKGKLSKS